ncbi:MAG: hypothetical protein C5S49_03245 [Candidatus Methanogaster sp.]|nr:MAG: hypothetical protein C5S49_03245 [ANME-2 cluster archaeon]
MSKLGIAKDSMVFGNPPVKIEITEHQAEIKTCHHCRRANMTPFPLKVTALGQYGSLPGQLPGQPVGLECIGDFFEDVFDLHPTKTIILQTNARCTENIKPANDAIKELLINAHIVNNDRTGLRVESTFNWLIFVSIHDLTYYTVHHECAEDMIK